MERPHKSDIDLAANLLKVHANPMEVLVFKVYEWKINDEGMVENERDTKFRRDVFLPAVIKGLRGQSWAKEYELAFAKLDEGEKRYWEDINGDKVRNAWVKVVSLIWYALDVENGGDFSRIDIAERYNINPGTVTRYINKTAEVVAYEEGPERESHRSTEIPLPLEYESESAQKYYTDDERKYYIADLKRYATNEGEFDLTNPIIADIIHQLIVNSYAMQRLNREIASGKKTTNPVLVKRLTELQDSNARTTKELIGLQKELGKLERNEESLGALKRRYVEVKEKRDPESEVKLEAELFEKAKKNSQYLGFVN